MLGAGVFFGYIGASIVLIFSLFFKNICYKEELLIVGFLFTFILADNFSGPFVFAQNLRFIVLGLTLVFLYKYNLFSHFLANKILPFSIIALIITILYSPLGYPALLRAAAYWLMAITVFKSIQLIYDKSILSLGQLLLLLIASYIIITLVSYIIPVGIDVLLKNRFKGFMGNPNGLGLLMLMFYPLIDLFVKRGEVLMKRHWQIIIKLTIVLVILLTGSRNAFFSIIIYESAYFLHNNKGLFLITLTSVVIAYYSISINDIIGFVQKLGLVNFFRVESLLDASGRTEVWEVAWREIKRSPWLGNGMMYDNHYIVDYAAKHFGSNVERHWSGIWNSYLSLMLNVGIAGVTAYGYFIREMYRYAQNKNLAFAFLVMSLFSAITESWIAASMNAFTPLFFLYWAVQSQPNHIQQKTQL